MKVLVLGANGMAGHTISMYFMEKGHDVTTFTTTPFEYGRNIVGDAFEVDKLKELILMDNFDAIINCIGLLNQVAENNPSKAVFLNGYLPHFIADVLKDSDTKLIQMSTDCVFAGNTGPYFENSLRDGLTFYDRTKAIGEVDYGNHLTFRNSIIGPDMNPDGIGLYNWFMKQEGALNGYTGAIWTGVTTLTLAKAMEAGIEQDLKGIYNLVNNVSISKYDLIQLFNAKMKNNQVDIQPSDSLQLDKSLRNSRTDFRFTVPSYEQMVNDMKQWIMHHPTFYPHYKIASNE